MAHMWGKGAAKRTTMGLGFWGLGVEVYLRGLFIGKVGEGVIHSKP